LAAAPTTLPRTTAATTGTLGTSVFLPHARPGSSGDKLGALLDLLLDLSLSQFQAAKLSSLRRQTKLLQPGKHRLDGVGLVGRAVALGQAVGNPRHLQHSADAGPRHNTGARRGRNQPHLGSAELALNLVR
jgi:hypothetical protein